MEPPSLVAQAPWLVGYDWGSSHDNLSVPAGVLHTNERFYSYNQTPRNAKRYRVLHSDSDHVSVKFNKRHSCQFVPAAACFGIVAYNMYQWHSMLAGFATTFASKEFETYVAAMNVVGTEKELYQIDQWKLQWGSYVLVAGGLLVLLVSLAGISGFAAEDK